MLRIFLKVPSFTFDSLNWMQQIRSYSFYILVIGQKSFIFLMTFWIIWLCVREQKGLRKKDHLEKCSGPLNKFPGNWFLHDMISWEHHDALHVSNNWLHTVQTVKCKGVNFEEIRNMQLPIFKLISQLHSNKKIKLNASDRKQFLKERRKNWNDGINIF